MTLHDNFATALRQARKCKGLTQEDFSDISSRTYLSSLERGLKSPTLEKVEQLASVLEIHPLSLLTLTYFQGLHKKDQEELIALVTSEVCMVGAISGSP